MTAAGRRPDNAGRTTVIGTRGSRLALAQTETVAESLRRLHPGLDLRLQTVSTEGDRVTSGPLPSWGRGVFVRDIEAALLAGEIDLAVHSLKDLPPQLPAGLAILAVPPRADPGDVLVSAAGRTLESLPRGATVGTSSLRRAAFLLAARPDLRLVPVRGNVDTRWRKLLDPSSGLDALVLAAAGLDRLGLESAPRAPIPLEVLLPAPGQGALGLEGREDDRYHREIAGALHDPATGAAVAAERRFVRDLESGCRLPVAALATVRPDDRLHLEGAVAAPDGSRTLRGAIRGPLSEAEPLGAALAARLIRDGALDLLRQAGGAAVGAVR
jgi:hydroxymethylbilane synthase